ncbi:hypothetical protein ACOMHN_002039 [Nucella lapillus]
MANSVQPDKTNMTDILTHLNIGRQRDRYNQPRPDPRRRHPNRRRPTPKADDDHVDGEDDVGNVTATTTMSIGEGNVGGRTGGDENQGGDEDYDHDHDHATDHEDFTCQPTSSQHSAYIRDNLDVLKKKCNEFHECTQELYSAENFHRILAGGNIQLSNMCGLMYANGGGKYTTLNKHCTSSERTAIRQGIGSRLASKMADPPQDDSKHWKRLNRCLQHNLREDEQFIDTACRLKKNSEFLCEDLEVNRVTEEFFNHEMEHLHCSCKAINAEAANADNNYTTSMPLAVRMGIAGGVMGLLIILIIVVVVLCCRHRKVKRELKKHRMQYLPSPHGEPSAIYQEIGDHSLAMDALRRTKDQGKLPSHYQFMDQAPALPERYVKDISRSRTNLADPEYLEPIPDPVKGRQLEAHSNDAYNASQCSQRSGENNVYHLAKNPGNTPPPPAQPESNYFDRIQPGNNPEDDGGYSSLGRKYASKAEVGNVSPEEREPLNRRAEASSGGPEEPKYFVLESRASENEPLKAADANTTV